MQDSTESEAPDIAKPANAKQLDLEAGPSSAPDASQDMTTFFQEVGQFLVSSCRILSFLGLPFHLTFFSPFKAMALTIVGILELEVGQ